MLHSFDQKYSNYCEILLQFKITFFYFNTFSNVIYSCDGKAEFSSAIDHSRTVLELKKYFLLLSYYFCGIFSLSL